MLKCVGTPINKDRKLVIFCVSTGSPTPTIGITVSSLVEGLELVGKMNAKYAKHPVFDPNFFKVGEVDTDDGTITHYWDTNKECWRTFVYPRYTEKTQ